MKESLKNKPGDIDYHGWYDKKNYKELDYHLKLANNLWDEYKYRHDLCWKLTFKLTLTVVALGVIPYVKIEIVEGVKYWILITPGLGLLFAILGCFKLNGELKLWKHIRDLYVTIQNEITVQYHKEKGDNSFKYSILAYIWALILLTLINFIYISFCWIPAIL